MVLAGSNCSFCGIASVDARWGQLEVDVLRVKVILEDGGAFVVQAVELGFEASLHHDGVAALEGCQDFIGRAIFHGFHVDVICVVTIHDEDVLHAVDGCYWEFSCLVGVYGSRLVSGKRCGEACVSADAVGEGWREGVEMVLWFLWRWGRARLRWFCLAGRTWWFGFCAFCSLS